MFVALVAADAAQRSSTPVPRRASNTVTIHKTGTSFLGVGVREITAERARSLNLSEERGVEVNSVEDDSPAAKAGLKPGDVVLDYNGQRVEGLEQFIRFVRETPVGRQTKILISRAGATQTLTATIGARDSSLIVRHGDEVAITLPRIPEIRLPDTPRVFTSWRSPVLGIESESLSSQLADFFGVKDGVLVRSVTKGSAAEKAGLKAGDVITKVDDKRVAGPREIASMLRPARKNITLTVVREKREMTINVTLDDDASLPRPRTVVRMNGFEL
ncbi:MAG: PDZ domain-containing protein [Bryobacteraceae bacterium]